MNAKIKIFILTVFCLCLITLASFVTSPQHEFPSVYVLCDLEEIEYSSYSTIFDFYEVECAVCELWKVEQVWNPNGLLEGTLHLYDLGSEPAIWYNVDCAYSREPQNSCTQYTVTTLGSNCTSFFVPCTKEDDEECIHD